MVRSLRNGGDWLRMKNFIILILFFSFTLLFSFDRKVTARKITDAELVLVQQGRQIAIHVPQNETISNYFLGNGGNLFNEPVVKKNKLFLEPKQLNFETNLLLYTNNDTYSYPLILRDVVKQKAKTKEKKYRKPYSFFILEAKNRGEYNSTKPIEKGKQENLISNYDERIKTFKEKHKALKYTKVGEMTSNLIIRFYETKTSGKTMFIIANICNRSKQDYNINTIMIQQTDETSKKFFGLFREPRSWKMLEQYDIICPETIKSGENKDVVVEVKLHKFSSQSYINYIVEEKDLNSDRKFELIFLGVKIL